MAMRPIAEHQTLGNLATGGFRGFSYDFFEESRFFLSQIAPDLHLRYGERFVLLVNTPFTASAPNRGVTRYGVESRLRDGLGLFSVLDVQELATQV